MAQKRRKSPGPAGLFGADEALRGLGLRGFLDGGFLVVLRPYLSSRKASKSGSKRGSWLSIFPPLSECAGTIGGGLFAALRDSAADGFRPCLDCSYRVFCKRYFEPVPLLRWNVEACGSVVELCNAFFHTASGHRDKERLRRLLNVNGNAFVVLPARF